MNEAELNRLISESVMLVLNEGIDELGPKDSYDANMNQRMQHNRFKQDTKNKGYSMGTSSATSAMENHRISNEMSQKKPLSKFRNKLQGALDGYKKGKSGIDTDQTNINNLTTQNSDMQAQLDQHNEFMNGTNIAGQKNAKSMVKKNVKTLANNYIQNNVDPVTVAQGVTGAAQDVNKYASVNKQKTANNKARALKAAETKKQKKEKEQAFQDMSNNSKYGFNNGMPTYESIDRAVSSALRNLLK